MRRMSAKIYANVAEKLHSPTSTMAALSLELGKGVPAASVGQAPPGASSGPVGFARVCRNSEYDG